MNKIYKNCLLALTFISILIFTGCGGGDTPEPTLQDKLQGTWKPGSITTNPNTFINAGSFSVVVSGSSITFNINGTAAGGSISSTSGTTVNTSAVFNTGTIIMTNVVVTTTTTPNTLNFSFELKPSSQKPAETFVFTLNKQ